jgi:hypothetical protein
LLLSAAIGLYWHVNSIPPAEVHSSLASSSERLMPQLPTNRFLHDRVGLAVQTVAPGQVSFDVINASAATTIALQHEVAGSTLNGSVLANVENLGTRNTCICWIVSLHPGSPLRANQPSDPRPANFDFFVIDARTGFAYSHYSGVDPSLPAG